MAPVAPLLGILKQQLHRQKRQPIGCTAGRAKESANRPRDGGGLTFGIPSVRVWSMNHGGMMAWQIWRALCVYVPADASCLCCRPDICGGDGDANSWDGRRLMRCSHSIKRADPSASVCPSNNKILLWRWSKTDLDGSGGPIRENAPLSAIPDTDRESIDLVKQKNENRWNFTGIKCDAP